MMRDIVDRLRASSLDEGGHELHCRCLDAADEIVVCVRRCSSSNRTGLLNNFGLALLDFRCLASLNSIHD